jgi:hypothetical protein
LKTLMRPWARGPGASAIGGAGVGDGERDAGSIAPGMMRYECWNMRDSTESSAPTKVACTAPVLPMRSLCLLTDALKLARASALSLG